MKKTLLKVSLQLKCFVLIKLFIFLFFISNAQVVVDFGKSYVNITKGINGGTIEVGDTLEFRSTFVVRCTSGCPAFVDSCAYYDTVKTGMSYIPGSLAVLTNEGKVYKAFTDASNDDCGRISGSNILINLGFNTTDAPATAFRRGRIRNTHKPSFYSSTCIMVASYKARVTAPLGSIVNTGGGSISYKPTSSPTPLFLNFPNNNTMISTNFGICTNTVGTNALGAEFNGSFGSGPTRNRGSSASVPATYNYSFFTTGGPGDYYYGIANNTSTQTNYSTSNAWPKPDPSTPSHRVFGVWDIIGDHTGAISPTIGNPAADTVSNNNRGYMLVVNASYRIDSAFTHTISGLCPNTYYELSAWFRNICSKCGCDSNGRGATNSAGPPFYIPTAAGDSSGVAPNLTIRVDGVDYYTTGNMRYTGLWTKKGFTYVTGPTQTSLTMSIRNNAPGGGGNDWAIDDISIATCTPTLNLVPSGGVNVCYGNQIDMYTTVRCFSSNYIHWTWERSTNGGVSWTNTGISGTGSPALVAGEWQYIANYPSFLGDSSVHNNMFRIRVASTIANLTNPGCSYTASNTISIWVNNCGQPLKTTLLEFFGKVTDGYAKLGWLSTGEGNEVVYEIQRSDDKINFSTVGIIRGIATHEGTKHSFTDPRGMLGTTFYRLKMSEGPVSGYSKTIVMNYKKAGVEIKSIDNPFTKSIRFELICQSSQSVHITLTDQQGRILKKFSQSLTEGINQISTDELSSFTPGTYNLIIRTKTGVLYKRLVKSN